MSRRKAISTAISEFAKRYHYRIRNNSRSGKHAHRGRAYILDDGDGMFSLHIRFSVWTCSGCGSRNWLGVDTHEWKSLKADLIAWGLTFVREDQNWGLFRFDPNNVQQATAVQRCLESAVITLRPRPPQKTTEVVNTGQAAVSKQTKYVEQAAESEGSDQDDADRQWLLDAEPMGGVQ